MNKEEFSERFPEPPRFNALGQYTHQFLEWTVLACAKCTVDGEDGSCLISLNSCTWW